jgi:hypothetical protein
MVATKNGNGRARNECATMGHDWEFAPEGSPAEFTCSRCPAIGNQCPEGGDAAEDCTRCRGTGFVELVELSLEEVVVLRTAAKRFKFMIQIFAQANGMSRADAIAELDDLIEGHQDFTAWANSLPERKKKPPAAVRATEGPGVRLARQTRPGTD